MMLFLTLSRPPCRTDHASAVTTFEQPSKRPGYKATSTWVGMMAMYTDPVGPALTEMPIQVKQYSSQRRYH